MTSIASSKRELRLLLRNAEALEFVVPVALADAEIEPAIGNQIKRRRLLGEQDRVVPRQHHHRGAEPQRARSHRQTREQRERGRHLVPAGEMVLDRKARMVAEGLGLDVEIEIVAKSLPGFRAKLVAVGLRRAEQTKAHCQLSCMRTIRPH